MVELIWENVFLPSFLLSSPFFSLGLLFVCLFLLVIFFMVNDDVLSGSLNLVHKLNP